MPIADCGFPPYVASQTAPGGPVTFQPGSAALQLKGPTILVEVGFEPALFLPDANQVKQVVDALTVGQTKGPPPKLVEALVDTGAADSCIDEDLAVELGLPVIDQGKCSGVGGEHDLNIYLGHIRIPSLGQVRYGRFIGAKLRAGKQPHYALIGRSQMAGMIMIYDGRTGAASLSL